MLEKIKGMAMYILLAVSLLVFFAVASLGMSQLSSKSQELVSLKLQNKTADSQLSNLAATKKQVQKYSYFNDVVKTVLPNDKDQAQAVLDIFQMAASSGIALQNITFPASNLGVRFNVPVPTNTGSGSSGTSTPATPAAPPLSQAKIVPGISGLYSLQLIITPQTGNQVSAAQATTYAKFLDFLNRIEHDRRTAQISTVEIQPQANSNYMGFTLTLNIFIKP